MSDEQLDAVIGTQVWNSENLNVDHFRNGYIILEAKNCYFGYAGTTCSWWSASEYYGSDAWYRYLSYNNSNLGRFQYTKKYGHYVRCVKD
jgi:uncharacterized protein (TIGR02145 family)